MPLADVVEGAVVAGVNRALYTAADAAHHVVSTPTNMVIEGAKTATVFIATHVVIGGLKLGCSAGWWLITSAASLAGFAIGAGATAAYNSFFAPLREQPKLLTWNNSYDYIGLPSSKSSEDSAALLETSSPTSPKAPSAACITRNVAGID